jgi:flagellar hook protein FlgE
MEERSGGFYVPTPESGDLRTGTSGSQGFGTVISGALETSTTDISKELAAAIETQTHYAANAQVISTISQMLDALMRL